MGAIYTAPGAASEAAAATAGKAAATAAGVTGRATTAVDQYALKAIEDGFYAFLSAALQNHRVEYG